MRLFLSLLIFGVLTTTVAAAPPARYSAPIGLAIYSDACVVSPAGDLLGERIGVLRLNRGYDLYVFFQDADSDRFDLPEIVQLDPYKGQTIGPDISFTIERDGKSDTFHGTISDTMIVGQFSDPRHKTDFGQRKFRLHRVSLDQKGYPDCGPIPAPKR